MKRGRSLFRPSVRVMLGFAVGVAITLIAGADDPQGKGDVREKIRKELRQALQDDLDLSRVVPGFLYKAAGTVSEADTKLRETLSKKGFGFYNEDVSTGEVFRRLTKVAGVKIDLSQKLQEISEKQDPIEEIAVSHASFDETIRVIGEKIGVPLSWKVANGAVRVGTADEEGFDREEHREKMREIIEEVAGEDARFLGDRYLLLYVEDGADSQEARKIRSSLEARRITVNFDATAFDAVIDFLRDVTGLNIVLSKEVQDFAGDLTIDLKLKDIRMKSFMNLLMDASGEEIEWVVRNDVIYLRTKEEGERTKPSRSFILIDISDILYVPPDYPAPKLGLGGLQDR